MNVIRLTSPYHLTLQQEPTPAIKDNEVLLQIQAVGICGSDMHRYRGDNYDKTAANDPLILGHEFAALVAAVGAQVKNVSPGDRVAVEAGIPCGQCEWCQKGDTNLCPSLKFCGVPPYDGALCEFMAWPGHLLFKLPDTLSFEDGVLMEILAIGLHSIDLAHIQPGQTAAVLGSGPIGLTVIHLLKTTQNILAITTDRLQYRNDFALTMGAQLSLNPEKIDIVQVIMDMTSGRGVDVVFEAAGVPQTCHQAVELCARGGKVIFIGIPVDDQTAFSTSTARRKGLTFRFIRRSRMLYPRCAELMYKNVVTIGSMVTHNFPLSKTPEAFDLVNQYGQGVIKAIIHPSGL